jgi:hypothetical protein
MNVWRRLGNSRTNFDMRACSLLFVLVVGVVMFGAGCTSSGATAQKAINPPRPTPGTANPADLVPTFANALTRATDTLAGRSGDARFSADAVTSVMYFHTTAGPAARAVGQGIDPSLADDEAWLFVEHGSFSFLGFHDSTPTPPVSTMWVLAIHGYSALAADVTGHLIDVSALGPPTVIARGQVPAIDTARVAVPGAPVGITPTPETPGKSVISVGNPTPVSGLVRIPVSTVGTSLPAYTGFNIHLRWDPALFHYSADDSSGTIITSPSCATAADSDGGGVVFGCTSLGGASTTDPGLLGTIALQPVGSGCSELHLFTLTGDHGDGSTGTYVVDVGTNTPDHLGAADYTVDSGATTSGQRC